MAMLVPGDAGGIRLAVERLRAHEPVAFPTETVYGLGAGTFDAIAVRRIYELKRRPAANPMISHVLGPEDAKPLVAEWPERADRLVERFWPGPLTLVLPRHPDVPDASTAGSDSIAVRAPAHPIAQLLIAAYGAPISAPSANRSGEVSTTTADHVLADYEDVDLLVLDGPPPQHGIESTVLDIRDPIARVLRPGTVTAEMLRDVIGEVVAPRIERQDESPGTDRRHYAPRTPAHLVDPAHLDARLAGRPRCAVITMHPDRITEPHVAIPMPVGAETYAARLYMALREADASRADAIMIECPEGTSGLWTAIVDRLQRATAG